jgi:hypothetical protein
MMVPALNAIRTLGKTIHTLNTDDFLGSKARKSSLVLGSRNAGRANASLDVYERDTHRGPALAGRKGVVRHVAGCVLSADEFNTGKCQDKCSLCLGGERGRVWSMGRGEIKGRR